MNDILFSSASVEWATPWPLFRELDAEFHFDLDPCSTHENAKCAAHFTQEEDGLLQDWGAKEYFAIRPMGANSSNGSKKPTMKPKKARLWSCLYRQGRIQELSMIIYIIKPKSVLSAAE